MRRICASHAARVNLANPSIPMVCAIHMGDSPGLRRGRAIPALSRHRADKNSKCHNTIPASASVSGICGIHMGPPPDQHQTATGETRSPVSAASRSIGQDLITATKVSWKKVVQGELIRQCTIDNGRMGSVQCLTTGQRIAFRPCFYGTRICPEWYQTATRPAPGQ